jgi:periplasmic protein TonB
MKYLHFFILLFISSITYAQNRPDTSRELNNSKVEDEKTFTKTEIPASYPEGEKELLKYIESNFNKQGLLNDGLTKGEHTMTIRFIVKKDGTAYDFVAETQNKVGDEIIRILKTIPKWTPAKQNGRIVQAYYRKPFSFSL